jgi:CDP-4-dehydro-6-deoxyglucose reductase
MRCACSCRPTTFRYHAGQYVEFILRDGARRSYSMANAPHTLPGSPVVELHIRHMPGGKFTDHVFSAMKEKEILRIEGPYGSFTCATIRQAHGAAGLGHGLSRHQGHHRAHAVQGHHPPGTCCTGAAAARRTCTWTTGCAQTEEMPHLTTCRWCPTPCPRTAGAAAPASCTARCCRTLADLSGHQVYACGAPIVVDSARQDFVEQAGLPEEEFFADSFTSEADKAHG